MSLPELLINSPTPGVREPLTTLKVELSEAGLEMEWEALVPTNLQQAGQYRVLIGSEIILCEAKAESTKKVKILERGAEKSIKVAHAVGAKIYQIATVEGLRRYTEGLGFEKSVAMAYRKAAFKLPSGAVTKVPVDTVIKDPGANINLAKGCYIVPSNGYYSVYGETEVESGTVFTNVESLCAIYVNGVITVRGSRTNATISNAGLACNVAGIIFCKKGDEIELRGYQFDAAKGEERPIAAGNPDANFLAVSRVGEGAVGPENELVGNSIAMAYRSAEQKIPNAAITQVKLDTVIKDPGGNISIAKGVYVVPSEGYYFVSGDVEYNFAAAADLQIMIWVNGVERLRGSRSALSASGFGAVNVSGIVFLQKNDELELRTLQTSGVEQILRTGQDINTLCVTRIGSGPSGPSGPEGKAGEWSNLTLESTVWEAATGKQTPAARTESGGAAARLRGGIAVKVGKSYAEGALVFTVPVAAIPPADVTLSAIAINPTNTSGEIRIKKTSGKAEFFPGVATGGTLLLDGLTYNLT